MLPKKRQSWAGCAGWMREHRRRHFFVFIMLVLAIFRGEVLQKKGKGLSSYLLPQQQTQQKQNKQQRHLENCRALMLHEGGHWVHQHANNESDLDTLFNTSSKNREMYLPPEIDWMASKNWPERWDRCYQPMNGAHHHFSKQPWYNELAYKAQLGNQCGACGVVGFEPTLSMWVPANDSLTNQNNIAQPDDHAITSPSLRLIERLAKASNTLCFVGDSIDFQIYDALRHNLIRQNSLQNAINISISESRQIPVNYTNETGQPEYTGFMSMSHIRETSVTLEYNAGSSTSYSTTFRYFLAYGWLPWNTVWMEGCNVVVLNLALHYDARNDMLGTHWGRPKYLDDFRAAITYLVDFVASGQNRRAVWR